MLLLELSKRGPAFETVPTDGVLINFITSGKRPPIPSYVPEPISTLIQDCWSQDPQARPGFAEIAERLEHAQALLV